ncbi:MAG: hypothetical protein AUI64_04280 [Acidobacteria bacterium 13_1_40CM_2_64_6]|nr:MAG: hypothetical protein AUH72_00555 [Acidobacteria bacterium 13_1_40CM_4_65_8]OLD54838.1 MAG: hypothetical protein AUI64_04280 [Acidobacteria bacterium 13_1_40CM_2_64_6]OLE84292.1 MAG: hypothetical protein AUF76_03805 [Acidobacteria bacterium 13_1_20CM_2_65_9]
MLLGVLLGTSAWMASRRFVSLPHDPDHVEYLFLSASWIRLAVCKEERPLWPRASPDYLPSLADAQARAWQQFADRGCTLCLSSEHGGVPPSALASLKPEPER